MMITTTTSIDDLLTAFFAEQAQGMKGLRHQRILRVEQWLRNCLETDGHRILTDGDLLRLNAEQVFDPDRAFVRMADASDLVFGLSIFVDPEWLMADRLDQSAQLRLADKLTGFLLARRLVDDDELACPLLDIRYGIDHARSALRRARLEAKE